MGVSAAVALVPAVFVAALWLPNQLQAESGAAVVALALAIPMLPAFAETNFAQLHIGMAALILPPEIPAAQPVHSDPTTVVAKRLQLGHINSPHGETNR